MKTLVARSKSLKLAGRWDIDYHLPAEGILHFPAEIVAPISQVAAVSKSKRDPTRQPDQPFQYIDIASVDVITGTIQNPQDLTGEEAPSRARKVVRAYDLIISTCRPTRGAIAVVPEELHGHICSTGFSVIRCRQDVNPFYLHFVLRLESTLEQFRKWGTGSSYPAILDEDVEKTRVPVPPPEVQDRIARVVHAATVERERAIAAANDAWRGAINVTVLALEKKAEISVSTAQGTAAVTTAQIAARIAALPPVLEDGGDDVEAEGLFGEAESGK
jgi:type I restriction enzyme S subunit